MTYHQEVTRSTRSGSLLTLVVFCLDSILYFHGNGPPLLLVVFARNHVPEGTCANIVHYFVAAIECIANPQMWPQIFCFFWGGGAAA